MSFPKFFSITLFVALLLWGPLDHSWPASMVIRMGYLILIPVTFYLILKSVWNKYSISLRLEKILNSVLNGIISLALAIGAFDIGTSNTYMGNTQYVRTREGMEPVGEDILVNGTDWVSVLMLLTFAALIFWYGVLRKGKKIDHAKGKF